MKWFKNLLKAIAGQKDRPLSNFTPRAQQVLALARKEADRLRHNYIGTEHVLLGSITLGVAGRGVATFVLENLGTNLDNIRKEVEMLAPAGLAENPIGNLPYTRRVKKALAYARDEAKALQHTYIGTEHLFLGLLRETDGLAVKALKNLNVDLEKTRAEILKLVSPGDDAQKSK